MTERKAIKSDISGFEVLKQSVLSLLNQFPGLGDKEVVFSDLSVDNGLSMEPESGALVYSERKFIDGSVKQECQFPFYLVCRSGADSSFLKMNVITFLDTIGAWICKEKVVIDGTAYQLDKYPLLSDGLEITEVTRFNSYALEPNENRTQDWVLPITVNYTHIF